MIQSKDIKTIAAEVRRFEARLLDLSIKITKDGESTAHQKHPKETGRVMRGALDLRDALSELRRA